MESLLDLSCADILGVLDVLPIVACWWWCLPFLEAGKLRPHLVTMSCFGRRAEAAVIELKGSKGEPGIPGFSRWNRSYYVFIIKTP